MLTAKQKKYVLQKQKSEKLKNWVFIQMKM